MSLQALFRLTVKNARDSLRKKKQLRKILSTAFYTANYTGQNMA